MPSERSLSRSAAVLAVACVLAACASTPPEVVGIAPFTTDGCSLFPDRSDRHGTDWCDCCLVHDLAYWRGGSPEDRLRADRGLRACVAKASRSAKLADLMFVGVRLGGGPYFPTWFRWGYGWPLGRGYTPLSDEEEVSASTLEQEYRASNPSLTCRDPSPPRE